MSFDWGSQWVMPCLPSLSTTQLSRCISLETLLNFASAIIDSFGRFGTGGFVCYVLPCAYSGSLLTFLYHSFDGRFSEAKVSCKSGPSSNVQTGWERLDLHLDRCKILGMGFQISRGISGRGAFWGACWYGQDSC